MFENFVKGNFDNYFKLRFLGKYLIGHKGYIAGGCFKNIFNGEKAKDIDVFFRSKKDFDEAKNYFSQEKDFVLEYENTNVTAFRDTTNDLVIELVQKEFTEPLEMIDSFDFTITKFVMFKGTKTQEEAMDTEKFPDDPVEEVKIYFHKDFWEHLHLKRLVLEDIDKVSYPLGVFNRLIRYCGYGYKPCGETKLKMVDIIRENDGDINTNNLYEGKD